MVEKFDSSDNADTNNAPTGSASSSKRNVIQVVDDTDVNETTKKSGCC